MLSKRVLAVCFFLMLGAVAGLAAPKIEKKEKKSDYFCFRHKDGALYYRCVITTEEPRRIKCYYKYKVELPDRKKFLVVSFSYDTVTKKEWAIVKREDLACKEVSKGLPDPPRGN